MRVAAIVPAFNESTRIGIVLDVLRRTKGLDEIIVVDDGSTDGTLKQVPRDNGVRAFRLEQNRGKGAALLAGARQSTAEVLLFVDADLIGAQAQQIESLFAPIVAGEAEMCVAVFRGGRWRTDWAQKLVPYISGQRALRREFFLALPHLEEARYGIETALSRAAAKKGLRVKMVSWHGVTHVMKEEKLGLARGLWERAKMYRDIGAYLYLASRNGKNGHSSDSYLSASPSPLAEKNRMSNPSED